MKSTTYLLVRCCMYCNVILNRLYLYYCSLLCCRKYRSHSKQRTLKEFTEKYLIFQFPPLLCIARERPPLLFRLRFVERDTAGQHKIQHDLRGALSEVAVGFLGNRCLLWRTAWCSLSALTSSSERPRMALFPRRSLELESSCV